MVFLTTVGATDSMFRRENECSELCSSGKEMEASTKGI